MTTGYDTTTFERQQDATSGGGPTVINTTTSSHREHRKSHSLTGFVGGSSSSSSSRWSAQRKYSDEELILKATTQQKGVWTSATATPNDHPLFSNINIGNPRPPKMPSNMMMSSPFGRSRKGSRHRVSKSLGGSGGSTTPTEQLSPTMSATRKTSSDASMMKSVAQLGACFAQNHPPPPPPVLVNKRDDDMDGDYHRHTLGSCRVDSQVFSRVNSPVVGARINSQRKSSLGPEDMLLLTGGKDDGMSLSMTPTSPTTTMVHHPHMHYNTPPPPPPPVVVQQQQQQPIRNRSMTSSPQVSNTGSSSRKSSKGGLRARASSLTSLNKKLGKLVSKTPTTSPSNSPKNDGTSPSKKKSSSSPKLLRSFKSPSSRALGGGGSSSNGYAPLGSGSSEFNKKKKPAVSPKQRSSIKVLPEPAATRSPLSKSMPHIRQTDTGLPFPPSIAPSTSSTTTDAFANMELPLLAKPSPTSFLTDATSMALRSSEQDPSIHQMSLPSKNELLLDARACHLLENNNEFEAWNSTLCGMSHLAMQEYVFSSGSLQTPETIGLSKEIVKKVLECGDMTTVVAYMAESVGDDDHQKREILICEAPKRHQLIVVYRGTDDEQFAYKHGKYRNGVSSSSLSSSSTKDVTSNILHVDQPVCVQPWLKDAYFGLEGRMAATLDRLTDENPFCDIVFTGIGFGGGLAQLASFRLATMRPTMRISCHVFGCTMSVGQNNFRQMANTLPNLKVMRVEYGSEASSMMSTAPLGGSSTSLLGGGATGGSSTNMMASPDTWTQIGHSIVLHPSSGTSQTTHRSNPPSVVAYRFEKHKPTTSSLSSSMSHMANRLSKSVVGGKKMIARNSKHSLSSIIGSLDSYINFLKEFPEDITWVRAYVGENVGDGVRGSNNEKRNMV